MITIVAVLFGMGLVEFGYLTAAVYFGLTKGQAAAAILGISLVAGAVMTARGGGGNGAVARPWKRPSNYGRPIWQEQEYELPESEWKRLRPFYAVAIQAMKNEAGPGRAARRQEKKPEGRGE